MTNTPRTDQLEDCDFHKYDADEVPLRVYRRMTEQARELERELADQAAMVDQLKADLEQERQDRKQAEIDITRALGERNDARAETMTIKAALDKALAENLAMRSRPNHLGA